MCLRHISWDRYPGNNPVLNLLNKNHTHLQLGSLESRYDPIVALVKRDSYHKWLDSCFFVPVLSFKTNNGRQHFYPYRFDRYFVKKINKRAQPLLWPKFMQRAFVRKRKEARAYLISKWQMNKKKNRRHKSRGFKRTKLLRWQRLKKSMVRILLRKKIIKMRSLFARHWARRNPKIRLLKKFLVNSSNAKPKINFIKSIIKKKSNQFKKYKRTLASATFLRKQTKAITLRWKTRIQRTRFIRKKRAKFPMYYWQQKFRTTVRQSWRITTRSKTKITERINYVNYLLVNSPNGASPDSEKTYVRRANVIRFKPGYQTLWRRYRAAIRPILSHLPMTQRKLTRKLSHFKKPGIPLLIYFETKRQVTNLEKNFLVELNVDLEVDFLTGTAVRVRPVDIFNNGFFFQTGIPAYSMRMYNWKYLT